MAIIRFGNEIADRWEPTQTQKFNNKAADELRLIEFEIRLWRNILEFIKDIRVIWNK